MPDPAKHDPALPAADLPPSPVVPTIALTGDGKRHGHLRLPYSRDDSAWGSVMIPVSVIANGPGPTALLIGGNHGDEYEGPVALWDLARSLTPDQITGRVILLPALNQPAFATAGRTSPIDRGNLNRSFPGHPAGTVTQKIADFVTRALLPEADIVLDIHSGGRTLDFLPFAAAHELPDPAHQARCVAAMRAFGAPFSMVMREIDAVGMLDTTAEAMGKTFVTTELGGGGTVTAASAGIASRGIRGLLAHAGILPAPRPDPGPAPSRPLSMADDRATHVAPASGLCQPLRDLGERVAEGEPLALIHPADRLGAEPVTVRAQMPGLLAGRHFPGLVKLGDFLAVIATEL
ncbi:N(2)-acetyl-L-2,4-diaminobutanoate deacetylase DoeB [Frigidibacter sp. MR17.14]|uniref:N(2)-acetyl-L-2,4-diaminobutanoate deacetylase DoeB n=1 Tax=Frigidibacter sp. MR17.14 TaxID=3126509 RepID=UPI003012BF85